MRNLILIILLVLSGCGSGNNAVSESELKQHIKTQYETCIYNFNIIVPECYTTSDIVCDPVAKCGEITDYINNYYYENNILLDIVKSDELSDKDSCYELVSIELEDTDYYCL